VQQTWPVPQLALVVHAQPVEVHFLACTSQHSPAVQSASDRQQAAHDPDSQHRPAGQSLSAQQVLDGTHAPPQQCCPLPHCASLVQPQLAVHWWLPVLQHCPATQSLSPQQSPATHFAPQHLRPAPHSESVVHAQSFPHACVVVLQHCPATQSAFEQHAAHVPPQHT
jgi:hypothetical protein